MLPVTSCADDGGLGTLRHVVLTAVSGDTVDLSALTCGTITLQSGAIHVDVDDLTEDRQSGAVAVPGDRHEGLDLFVGKSLEEIEKHYITETLKLTAGNREEAANLLGIGERTLYRKLKEYAS